MKIKRQLRYSPVLCVLVLLLVITGCQKDKIEPKDLVRATVMDDPTLPSLDINGTKLHIQTFGDPANPVIFMLHGGPGVDSRELLSFTETHNGYNLTDDYFLVIWDQRGTGLSQRHDDADLLKKEVYQKDLEEVINYFAPDSQVIILAHSFGGIFAAEYMNNHPEKIAGAILLEPGAFSSNLLDQMNDEGTSMFAEWQNDYLWAEQFVSMNDHERADYNISIGYTGLNDSERESVPFPNYRYGAAVMFHLKKDLVFDNDYDFTPNLNQVTPEVLFIVGGSTGYASDEEFEEKQRVFFTNSRLEVIPDAGHDDLVWAKVSESMEHIKTYLESL